VSDAGSHRCGVVALLGRPNAGKSALLNALVGEKLAIVSPKAQTTRGRMLGVVTRPGAQLLLHDTPGLHPGEREFNRLLCERALATAEDADVRALLFAADERWGAAEEQVAALPAPVLLVRTKCDLPNLSPVPGPERFAGVLETSAERGEGIEALLEALSAHLPEGPALYPEDTLTDVNLRFLAAEQVREVVFEQYRDEIPYGVAVEVEEWKEDEESVRVRANLLVERESQKGIVVGAGGRALGELGREARRRLAERLGKPVHLKLWVKLDPNWTKRPKRARELGYL
jgi:GTP-binding protein Era